MPLGSHRPREQRKERVALANDLTPDRARLLLLRPRRVSLPLGGDRGIPVSSLPGQPVLTAAPSPAYARENHSKLHARFLAGANGASTREADLLRRRGRRLRVVGLDRPRSSAPKVQARGTLRISISV